MDLKGIQTCKEVMSELSFSICLLCPKKYYIIRRDLMNILRKKLSYFLIILIAALLLTGCSGGYPNIPDTSSDIVSIKSVIYEYFSAINNQNWNKAKSLCVYGSDRYYQTGMLEDVVNNLSQNIYKITINIAIAISNVKVNGNHATVKGKGALMLCVDDYCETKSAPGVYYLQKIGESWKIYGP